MTPSKTGKITRAVGLLIVGALGLVACGSNNNPTTAAPTTNVAPSGSVAPSMTGSPVACASGSILASGSSAQKNAMTQWVANFQTGCSGATINYQAVGSGAGVTSFIGGNTAFAGSDSALKPTEIPTAAARCGAGPAIDLPMVSGAIAVAYNLPTVPKLTLTPVLIAEIFAGKITKWNDPAIVAVNGSAQLPGTAIQTFHRSDSSGTTDNFTKYLVASASSAWPYGNGKDWKAPAGQGAKGSDLVTSGVKAAEGGVGYVEYSFAKNANLGVAAVDNGGGAVELSADSAAKAVASATVIGIGSDLSLKLDYSTKVAGAYPIVLVTYEITCLRGLKAADLALTKAFLTYTASDAGQGVLTALGYAPLPRTVQMQVLAAVAALA